MTSEKFRTNPLFLRNQFHGIGVAEIPLLKKQRFRSGDVKLIGYDKAKLGDSQNKDHLVHFFLDDYKFESLWKDPGPRVEKLSQ